MKDDAQLNVLRRFFRESLESRYSSFYRDIYAKQGFAPGKTYPQTLEEWRAIPYISKTELTEYPYHQRAFRPLEEIVSFRLSSGTSKSPVVLSLRNRVFPIPQLKEHASRMLFCHVSLLHQIYAESGVMGVGVDVADPAGAARLAKSFGIDGMEMFMTHLRVLTPALEKEMDLSKIRLILLDGEGCNKAGYEYIHTHYPNALIFTSYGLSEIYGIQALPCETLAREEKNLIHFFDGFYPELIDTETGTIIDENGKEGEIVMSAIWENNIFPVIRFRTGDIARRVESDCGCGKETYEVLGRIDFSRLKVTGGVLQKEEIERVLAAYQDSVHDDFELHVFDIAGEGEAHVRFELRVRPREGKSLDLKTLARSVASELRVGPNQTIQSGVEKGFYESLRCTELPPIVVPQYTGKHQRIVHHGWQPRARG